MIEALKERGLSGFYNVGDQSSLAPDNIMGSLVWNLEGVFRQMVTDVQNGTFQPGKFYQIGLKDDGVVFKLNDQYSVAEIPADVLAKMQEAEQQIKDGTLRFPTSPSDLSRSARRRGPIPDPSSSGLPAAGRS